MASLLGRARLSAGHHTKRRDTETTQTREELKIYCREAVTNMRGRLNNAGITNELIPNYLHGKNYDQTYFDFGQEKKYRRTDALFDELIKLADGDEVWLLDVYRLELQSAFPINSKSFEWAPRFVRTPSGHKTIMHAWRRKKVSLVDDEEVLELVS